MLVDTHCHLDFPEFDNDRGEVIRRAKDDGISYIIDIGSSLPGSQRAVELSGEYDFIYASVGMHPHEADKFDNQAKSILEKLARHKKVVAIGEAGLDYYRNYSKAENQKVLFEYSINLAKSLNLPLVVHTRQAEADTIELLNKAMPVECVVHCFSGDEHFLKKALDLGFLISFTCNITYKKAHDLRNIVKLVPLDRLMLETDAPFLSPEGLRGRRNEPSYVKLLAAEMALLKEKSVEEIANITTDNAKKFFKLP